MFDGSNIVLVLIFSAVSLLLTAAEYLLIKKRRAVFFAISALFMCAAVVFMIYKGAALCDPLIFACFTLAVRLAFEVREGRKEK